MSTSVETAIHLERRPSFESRESAREWPLRVSPRFDPETDVGARHRRDASATLREVRRRSFIALAAVLGALAAAAAATSAPPPEWWLQTIAADQSTPPGPGVPIVVVDGAVDSTQPAFAGRPNTTYLDAQLLFGADDIHATAVASLAAAPGTGGFTGVYPQAALEVWDAGRGADGIDGSSAALGIRTAALHCPAVINLSFGGIQPNPDVQDAILYAVRAGCLVVAAAGNSGLDGNPVTYPASYPARVHRRRDRRERCASRLLELGRLGRPGGAGHGHHRRGAAVAQHDRDVQAGSPARASPPRS